MSTQIVFFILLFNWFTKYYTGDKTWKFKISWSLSLDSNKFEDNITKRLQDSWGQVKQKEASITTPEKKIIAYMLNWRTSRIRFPMSHKNTALENFQIFICELCRKFFTANEYMAHTLFIESTERTPCRLTIVLQGFLKSPHCSTLLIHWTCPQEFRWVQSCQWECPPW